MRYFITQEQLQAVLNYLGSRPYVEVIKIIQLLGQLQPAPAESGKKDEGYKVMEAAKGGMVKKYMGGGSVHKNKKNMITTKGWGASRKT